RKQHLPNYAVFDEERWFVADDEALVVDVPVTGGGDAVRVGITICEDAWVEHGPVPQAAGRGAQVVVNLSASPWRLDRSRDREHVVSDRAREGGVWVALCNQACGQ